MSIHDQGARSRHRFFLLWMGLILPLMLAACAVLLRDTGLDDRLSAFFYDADSQQFLIATNGWFEWIGHRLGKSLVLMVWLLLVAAAVAAGWIRGLAAHRTLLWTTVLAMALGPTVVTVLKDINSHACPWSLTEFGGTARYSADWFVSRIDAGRCFPGGHAAGGFSLVALAFAGEALSRPKLRRLGLALAVVFGVAFSLLRVAQGAHFLSHNLWAAAVDLWMAALVFAPLLWRAPGREPASMPADARASVG